MNKKTLAEDVSTGDSKERFINAMVDSMSEGVLACDTEGRIILSNQAVRNYFDLPEQHTQFEYWHAYATIKNAMDESEISIRSSLVDPVLSGDKPDDIEVVVIVKGSPPRFLRMGGKLITGDEGEAIGAVITIQDNTAHKLAENRAERLALFDVLTSLPNRRQLIGRLQQEIASAIRHATVGAVLFVNLDKFKAINDSLGHAIGDDILRQVANRIGNILRGEDTIARLGSDEFIIILPQLDEVESNVAKKAQAAAKKILESIATPFELQGIPSCNITASIGIVLFPTGGDHVDDLLKYADSAVHRVKQEGGNQYSFFNVEMQETAYRRMILEQDIASIVEKKEFEIHFQPIVDVEKNSVVGVEALSRWHHPKYGTISPVEFIPMAEESGDIHTIGNWVLMHALRSLKHWISTGLIDTDMSVSVNISPRQLADPAFVQYVLRALKIFELDPSQIKLEITEGVLLENIEEPISKMNSLRERGVRFSIDDFGTGYSSLYYLKRLPVSQLKIDKSFIDHIETDADDAVITETIISIARRFKLDVVAEGVENEGQMEILKKMGCNVVQGYFIAKPMLSNEFVNWMKNRK